MQHHKLDFRNKNHLEQLVIFDKLVNSLGALPADLRDDSYLAELRTVAAAARASHSKIASLRTDLKAELSHRQALFLAGRKAANQAAVAALLKTKWRPVDILAAGLDLPASNKTPVGVPAAPTNLRGVPTAGEGEALLRWKRTVRRCTFEVQWHTDPPEADRWHQETSCLQQKTLVTGLVSGAKYWFRIRAVNAHGASAWSEMASVRVK